MSKQFDGVTPELAGWLGKQRLFFVATAPLAADGLINCSPKGADTFRVLRPHEVAYLDLTGSGIETVAHLRENGRICLMFLSFGDRPRIVRLHGTGSVLVPGDAGFDEVVRRHPENPSTRAVITVDVTRISDACGWGVPVMDVQEERDLLRRQAEKKGPEGMADYRRQKNAVSIDGLPGL